MRKRLIRSGKIEIRLSQISGYGVFAKEDIKEGTILEECRLIFIPFDHKVETLGRYLWHWDSNDPMRYCALPIGYGSLYNSSEDEEPSVRVEADEEEQILVYIANKSLKKNEELTMKYKFYKDYKYYTTIEPQKSENIDLLVNGYGGDDRSELISRIFPGVPIA